MPTSYNPHNGEGSDENDAFNLNETLQKLGIQENSASKYEQCHSEADVIAKREEIKKEYWRKCEEEDRIKKFQEEKKRRQDLIKSARIPKIYSSIRASNFKITDRNETSAITAIQAITNNSGLFIYGECGTGKTMLASIIANERAELFKSSMFLRTVDILHELNPFLNNNKTETSRKRNLILKIPCLIIDDLGAEKPSDFTRATLFDILDYRMNESLQTIITTNFNINELQNRLNSNEELNLSEKIIRRIKTTCKLIELNHF